VGKESQILIRVILLIIMGLARRIGNTTFVTCRAKLIKNNSKRRRIYYLRRSVSRYRCAAAVSGGGKVPFSLPLMKLGQLQAVEQARQLLANAVPVVQFQYQCGCAFTEESVALDAFTR